MAETADSEGAPEPTFREHFWNIMCGYQQFWYTLFVLAVALLALLLFSLAFISPGSSAYVIATIDLIILVITIVGTGYVTLHCRNV